MLWSTITQHITQQYDELLVQLASDMKDQCFKNIICLTILGVVDNYLNAAVVNAIMCVCGIKQGGG